MGAGIFTWTKFPCFMVKFSGFDLGYNRYEREKVVRGVFQ